MKFDDFIKVSLEIWSNYFNDLNENFRRQIKKGKILFPNIALFSETREHYIIEFFGADESFNGLNEKRHKKISSVGKYLYQFNLDNCLINPGSHNGFRLSDGGTLIGGFLSRELKSDFIEKRIPFQGQWHLGPTIICPEEQNSCVVQFGECSQICFLANSLIGNVYGSIQRFKYVLGMQVVKKSIKDKHYSRYLKNRLNRSIIETLESSKFGLLGVVFCKSPLDQRYCISAQFLNIFLFPELRETTIGEFLRINPLFLKTAFSCKSFIYEPEFEWIEGNLNSIDRSINPDLMIESDDRYFHICDLKTAMLDKENITTGGHSRRRFISKVQDGIAQLGNYREYFEYEANKQLALSKYGIRISDPNLILVVGSYENASPEEIREASRMATNKLLIIDYDTLNTMFLRNSAA